ncbi:hypothetical protein [Solicola sp. PLA-1-18]|uniref:hypothetical protein n=1 Tax=Solicola sp. PLA-1-18 TaxID=3380532 RepID=UPI003B7E1E9B
MKASEITWNDEAHAKILDDADRVLREAVVELAGSMQGEPWEQVYEEINARMKGRFIDYQPGPDVRRYAEAVADGDVQTDA